MTILSLRRRKTSVMIACCACLLHLPVVSAATAQYPSATPEHITLAQARQCERRAGPFSTQDTAWQRWRQARDRGVAVSRGVVPCYDQYGTRGYCFFTFHPC